MAQGGTVVSHTFVCVIATIILIPCVFLRDLKVSAFYNLYTKVTQRSATICIDSIKEVSRFSMGCSVAQFVVMGLIIFYCFLEIRKWQWSQGPDL